MCPHFKAGNGGLTYIDLPLLLRAFEDGVQLVDLLHGVLGRRVLPDQHKVLHNCKIAAARGSLHHSWSGAVCHSTYVWSGSESG